MVRTVHTVLAVEDDSDIADAIEFCLREAGYDVVVATSPAEALAQIDAHTFAFILADLFRDPDAAEAHRHDPPDLLASARELLEHASPTPVGVMTAWAVAESDALAQGFACLLRKPFDVDVLLTCIAKAIQMQLSPEEEQWAASVRAVFAALGAGDMSTLERLCTEDVRFVAPRHAETPLVLEGRTAYLAYAAARLADLPGMRFVDVRVYSLPHGLAARYELHWFGTDGDELSESGATAYRFAADGRLQQIGVDYNPERHRQLAGVWSGGDDETEGVA